jgi:hypothetical protein
MSKLNISKTAVCAALVLGAQAMVAAPAFATTSPFNGTWTSVDTDGSNQVLTVRGSGAHTRAVSLFDDAGSVCGGAPTLVAGTGTIDDIFLGGLVAVNCLPGGNAFHGRVFVEFMYDESTDTLVEPSGVVWHRAG